MQLNSRKKWKHKLIVECPNPESVENEGPGVSSSGVPLDWCDINMKGAHAYILVFASPIQGRLLMIPWARIPEKETRV